MSITRKEYIDFFEKWLYREFPRNESDCDNYYILKKVEHHIENDEQATEWGNRSCWTMYNLITENSKYAFEGHNG